MVAKLSWRYGKTVNYDVLRLANSDIHYIIVQGKVVNIISSIYYGTRLQHASPMKRSIDFIVRLVLQVINLQFHPDRTIILDIVRLASSFISIT